MIHRYTDQSNLFFIYLFILIYQKTTNLQYGKNLKSEITGERAEVNKYFQHSHPVDLCGLLVPTSIVSGKYLKDQTSTSFRQNLDPTTRRNKSISEAYDSDCVLTYISSSSPLFIAFLVMHRNASSTLVPSLAEVS